MILKSKLPFILILYCLFITGCSVFMAHYPKGEPIAGNKLAYTIVPPSDAWFRDSYQEQYGIDLALAKDGLDGLLTVSIDDGTGRTLAEFFSVCRESAVSQLNSPATDESDITVSIEGEEVPAKWGEYCGTQKTVPLVGKRVCLVEYCFFYQNYEIEVSGFSHDNSAARQEVEQFIRSFSISPIKSFRKNKNEETHE